MRRKYGLLLLLVVASLIAPLTNTAAAAPTGRQSVFEVVNGWENFGSMKTVFAPRGHGNVGGVYTPGIPIEGLELATAQRLIRLRNTLDLLDRQLRSPEDKQSHIGLLFQGDEILLEGRPNGAITTRTTSTIGRPWMGEISGVFYDPRAESNPEEGEFAVRLESVYCGDGHRSYAGCTMYVELGWDEMEAAVMNARFYISSTAHMRYDPVKNHNMMVGLEEFAARGQNLSGSFEFTRLLGLWDEATLARYKVWWARENGVNVPRIASGICANTSVLGNSLNRLMMAHGIEAKRWSEPHWESQLQYVANGTDALLDDTWTDLNFRSGVRGIMDTSVATPNKLAKYELPTGVTVSIDATPVYYNPGDSLMVYAIGVRLLP
jgi:hypothetical protein